MRMEGERFRFAWEPREDCRRPRGKGCETCRHQHWETHVEWAGFHISVPMSRDCDFFEVNEAWRVAEYLTYLFDEPFSVFGKYPTWDHEAKWEGRWVRGPRPVLRICASINQLQVYNCKEISDFIAFLCHVYATDGRSHRILDLRRGVKWLLSQGTDLPARAIARLAGRTLKTPPDILFAQRMRQRIKMYLQGVWPRRREELERRLISRSSCHS